MASSSHHEEGASVRGDTKEELGKDSAQQEREQEQEQELQLQLQPIEVELAAGARAFAFKNYAVATECFSKACEQLMTRHPNHTDAIIDAHMSYGKALLRNAISLGDLLGGRGLDHQNLAAELEDSSPRPADASSSKDQKGIASTSQPADKGKTSNPKIYFSGDSSDEDGEDAADEAEDATEAVEEALSVEEELESAFQTLEFTRQSIQSQIDSLETFPSSSKHDRELLKKKYQNQLVDVYDLLAQVHQEGEQFELAVESYQTLLEIKKSSQHFSPGSISETHLMIALALELIQDDGTSIKGAIEHVNQAIETMKRHLKTLEGTLVPPLEANGPTTRGKEGEEKIDESPEAAQAPTPAPAPVARAESEDRAAGSTRPDDHLRQEMEEVKVLILDLEGKRDELILVPTPPPLTTEGDKALEAYLATVHYKQASPSSSLPLHPTRINDLNGLVKKKKRRRGSVEKDSQDSSSLLESRPDLKVLQLPLPQSPSSSSSPSKKKRT